MRAWAAASVGAKQFSKTAYDLELGAQEAHLHTAQTLYEELARQFAALSEVLEQFDWEKRSTSPQQV